MDTTIVKISDLMNSPVPVHVHSNKQTEHISTSLDSKTNDQIIRVAKLNSKMYIIDGHMLVEAYRKRGVKLIHALIYKVDNIKEVITLHVKHNMNNPPNPIQLVQIILYMRKAGDSDREIAKSLRVNKFITNILHFQIGDEAVKELGQLLKELSEKYFSVNYFFPQNLIEWIFRQPKEKQHAATIALRKLIYDSVDMSERKFVWPTILEIHMLQRHNETNQPQKVKPISLSYDNEGMRGRPKNTMVGSSVVNKPPSKSEISKIGDDNTPTSKQKLAFKCPHGSLMYTDGKSRVFYVEDDKDETIVRLQHIDMEDNIYKISNKCGKFMHLKNKKIFLKMCTRNQALKILKNMNKKDSNVCILSSAEL